MIPYTSRTGHHVYNAYGDILYHTMQNYKKITLFY